MKSLGSILAGMVVVMFLVVSGCNTAGKAFARSLAATAAHQAVASSVQNEIEGPRGTTVNVNNPSSGYTLPPGVPQRMEPSLIIYRWDDCNGDRKPTLNELLGKVNDSINISNMGMQIGTNYGATLVSYTVLDSSDNVILKCDSQHGGFKVYKGGLPSGKYTIVARAGNNLSLSRELMVTGNP